MLLIAMNNPASTQHPLPWKTKMPVKHDQFIILMTDDFDINHSSLKHNHQNIIVSTKYNDILMHIESTQFDLILLKLTENNSDLITRIKDPLCINNKTPIIAIINPEEESSEEKQCPMEFDGWLIEPIAEEQLNKTIDLWKTKTLTLALNYIQIILNKTKNNQRLALTIFEKLFEELPMQIIAIKDALDNNQYNLAQEITHKLNGSVSFCGLTNIQQPANALENSLLNNNYANTHQQFMLLQQHTLNFTRHRESILANLDQH